MHVISKKRLNQFSEKYPETERALKRWYGIIKNRGFNSFAELREVFPSADLVDDYTIFNVGGNKVRLITAIHYNRQKMYILYVLTHKEYDSEKWRYD